MLCAGMLFDPDDRIFIEDPAYYGARKARSMRPGWVRPDPRGSGDRRRADPGRTTQGESRFADALHQFPTGATLALDRPGTDRMGHYDIKPGSRMITTANSYASRWPGVQGLDRHDRTIYIGTFTVALSRCGSAMPCCTTGGADDEIARTLLDGHSAPMAQLHVGPVHGRRTFRCPCPNHARHLCAAARCLPTLSESICRISSNRVFPSAGCRCLVC